MQLAYLLRPIWKAFAELYMETGIVPSNIKREYLRVPLSFPFELIRNYKRRAELHEPYDGSAFHHRFWRRGF